MNPHVPQRPDTRVFQAVRLQQEGKLGEAAKKFEFLCSLYPKDPQILTRLGTLRIQLGRIPEGIRALEKSLQLQPQQPQTWFHYAQALVSLQKFTEGLSAYERSIQLQPDFAEAHNNRGLLLHRLGRHAEELESFARAAALRPGWALAHFNLGNAYQEQRRPTDALESYDRALAHDAGHAGALANRGNVLKILGRRREAMESYTQSAALAPDSFDAFYNRGLSHQDAFRFEEAVDDFDRALALQPDHAMAHYSRANALVELGRFEGAWDAYDEALRRDPGDATARMNKAMLLLLLGEFEEGWRLYESRWAVPAKLKKRNLPGLPWLGGEPLAGKTLFIHSEQGLGDILQFCRYAKLAENAGARVILEAPPSLVPLLSTLSDGIRLVAEGQAPPAYDFHCPMMSLPLAFGTTAASIPAATPYLFPYAGQKGQWRDRLGPRKRPRIGVAWSGRPDASVDFKRSLPPEHLAPLFRLPFEFHSLQKKHQASDEWIFGEFENLRFHGADLKDFSDTAALASEMDLILSVDTSVAHLAGALGKPLWVLLPRVPDFRWLWDRGDSPWYPTARLFRQSRSGDWPSVVSEVVTSLRSYMEGIPSGIRGEFHPEIFR